jgi:mono/diheme cytochrome c family protein
MFQVPCPSAGTFSPEGNMTVFTLFPIYQSYLRQSVDAPDSPPQAMRHCSCIPVAGTACGEFLLFLPGRRDNFLDFRNPVMFMRAHWQQWKSSRWVLLAFALLCLGAGIYYADLLKAAFARNPIPRTAESITRGRLLFQQQCAICHGERGLGDGPVAASLKEKPDDLSKIARPPIFPDGIVVYRIANGKNLMPAFKATLSEPQLWDLLNFIRSLRTS